MDGRENGSRGMANRGEPSPTEEYCAAMLSGVCRVRLERNSRAPRGGKFGIAVFQAAASHVVRNSWHGAMQLNNRPTRTLSSMSVSGVEECPFDVVQRAGNRSKM